MLYAVFLGLLL
jgi:hypothetical protein